jgi:hypothetical protein
MTSQSSWMVRVGWVAILLSYPRAWGQIPIHYVEGKVLLDGQPVTKHTSAPRLINGFMSPGVAIYPVMRTGEILETANGRAESAMGLYLDQNSSFRILSGHREDATFEIQSGHAIVNTTYLPGKSAVTVEYQGATIVVEHGGESRIDVDLDRLRVYRGKATITYGVMLQCDKTGACRLVVGPEPAKTVELHKGEQVSLNKELQVSTFDTKDRDAFARWVARRLVAQQPSPLPPPIGLADQRR